MQIQKIQEHSYGQGSWLGLPWALDWALQVETFAAHGVHYSHLLRHGEQWICRPSQAGEQLRPSAGVDSASGPLALLTDSLPFGHDTGPLDPLDDSSRNSR